MSIEHLFEFLVVSFISINKSTPRYYEIQLSNQFDFYTRYILAVFSVVNHVTHLDIIIFRIQVFFAFYLKWSDSASLAKWPHTAHNYFFPLLDKILPAPRRFILNEQGMLHFHQFARVGSIGIVHYCFDFISTTCIQSAES